VSELRIAIVGFGKIARTRHVPVIAGTPGARLVAIADPNPASADVPYFPGLQELLRDGPAFDAVALCTPPQIRSAQAAIALAAGKHVVLEKPALRHAADVDRVEVEDRGIVVAAGAPRRSRRRRRAGRWRRPPSPPSA